MDFHRASCNASVRVMHTGKPIGYTFSLCLSEMCIFPCYPFISLALFAFKGESVMLLLAVAWFYEVGFPQVGLVCIISNQMAVDLNPNLFMSYTSYVNRCLVLAFP